jgi:hypothetical protein
LKLLDPCRALIGSRRVFVDPAHLTCHEILQPPNSALASVGLVKLKEETWCEASPFFRSIDQN